MANMFSGNNDRTIPRSLAECTRANETVDNLHRWSERLETWGAILFGIIVVAGVAISFLTASEVYELEGQIQCFVLTAAKWAIYAFVEYCIYHALALLISALASITQNTMISANIALYEAKVRRESCVENVSTKEAEQTEKKIFNDQNSNAVFSKQWNKPVPEGMWACKKCGTHNKNAYGQCKHCGEYRK